MAISGSLAMLILLGASCIYLNILLLKCTILFFSLRKTTARRMGMASYSPFLLVRNTVSEQFLPPNTYFIQILLEVFHYYCWWESKAATSDGLDAERNSDSVSRSEGGVSSSPRATRLGFEGWKAFARDFGTSPLVYGYI